MLTGRTDWAGGETDYSQGPFSMYVKSMIVTDYSTGSSYSYGDKSGSWQSIVAEGGKVNGNSAAEPKSTESAPAVTATVDTVPMPWSGTHKETSSFVPPNVWPWVATGSPTAAASDFPDSSSSNIQPPGGGSVSEQPPTSIKNPSEWSAKTHSSLPQSTIPFTSVPWDFSSAVSFRSGPEPSGTNLSRHATSSMSVHVKSTQNPTSKSTSKSTSTSSETETETGTFSTGIDATATIKSPSHAAPSKNGEVHWFVAPEAFGLFLASLGVMVLL